MDFGGILSESWKEYKQNFKLYSKLILLFVFIPTLLITIINQIYLWKIGYNALNIPYIVISSILGLLLIFITVIASISIYVSCLHNKRKYPGALKGGLKYYWKYVLFNIVIVLFLIPLFIAFLIPGIVFMVYWVFAVFFLIGDNKGIIDSLKESFNLVKGKWWRVLGYSLLFFLIMVGISIIFSIPSWPTGIILFVDALSNPELYATDVVPTTLSVVHGNIESFFELLSRFVILPLSILFYKNFYLIMKKESKIKKKK